MSELIKVKPWGKDQGEYVLIEAADFDPAIHTKADEDEPKRRTRKAAEPDQPEA